MGEILGVVSQVNAQLDFDGLVHLFEIALALCDLMLLLRFYDSLSYGLLDFFFLFYISSEFIDLSKLTEVMIKTPELYNKIQKQYDVRIFYILNNLEDTYSEPYPGRVSKEIFESSPITAARIFP